MKLPNIVVTELCLFINVSLKVDLCFVSANVDVEKPEFESESFRVLVFRKLRIQVHDTGSQDRNRCKPQTSIQ